MKAIRREIDAELCANVRGSMASRNGKATAVPRPRRTVRREMGADIIGASPRKARFDFFGSNRGATQVLRQLGQDCSLAAVSHVSPLTASDFCLSKSPFVS